MKKILLAALFAAITASAYCVPDFKLSAGAGFIYGYQFKNAKLKDEFKDYTGNVQYSGLIEVPSETTTDAMRQGLFDTKEYANTTGINLFLDGTFFEVTVDMLWSKVVQKVGIPVLPQIRLNGEQTYEYLFTQMQFGLLAKYPFMLGNAQKVSLSPLVGFSYQVALKDDDDVLYKSMQQVKAKGYDVPNLGEYWNSFWVRAGLGCDYSLTENFFLRGEVLYNLKMPNKYENSMADYWTEDIAGMTTGPTVSISAGYTFKTFASKPKTNNSAEF
ncbi:MAG: hypothetical protein Ta2G_03210 [Termitinemataceae bacterium]|nr:MAG: hypothetical protein Ta2G_03210 [Termitinemataceae bacterium]